MNVDHIYVSAVHTKNFFQGIVLDTISLNIDKQDVVDALNDHSDFVQFKTDTTILLKRLIKKPREIKAYFAQLEVSGDRIVILLTYRYSFEKVRAGGGGIGFAYDTGFCDHYTDKAVYVGIYLKSELVYLNNSYQSERFRKPDELQFVHEFSSDEMSRLLAKAFVN